MTTNVVNVAEIVDNLNDGLSKGQKVAELRK